MNRVWIKSKKIMRSHKFITDNVSFSYERIIHMSIQYRKLTEEDLDIFIQMRIRRFLDVQTYAVQAVVKEVEKNADT